MLQEDIIRLISQGRTDLIINLLKLDNWKELLHEGPVRIIQWLVYYDDVTALKLLLDSGGDLSSIDIHEELANAAFFGHWKICDFLIKHGADVNYKITSTEETPLHNAFAKAGRPYYRCVVRLLLEHGADPNARTMPGKETGAFMRDVRTKGETPLHRAAAYGDTTSIQLLLDAGADKTIKDAHGDTPLSWASIHLRPGRILYLLQHGAHRVSEKHIEVNTSDHGAGWGNTMDWNLFGDYCPESLSK